MALFDRSDIVRVRLDPVQGHVMRGDARGVAAIEAALAGRRTEAVVSVRGAQLRHRLSHADRRLAAAHAARVCRGWW